MIPDFPVHISEEDVLEDATELLRSVRPAWSDASIQFKVFTEGITNKLIGFYTTKNPDDIVLLRIYGKNSEVLIDRTAEINTIKLLSSFNYAAPLYATFSNGICYGFVPGETLNETTVRDEVIQRLTAEAFANIHCLHIDNSKEEPILFQFLKRCLNSIPADFMKSLQEKRHNP